MVPKPSTVQPADVGPKKTPFQRGNRTENRTGRAYGVSEIRHTSAKRGRNLDIRLGSVQGITDPWPTPSAAVRRSAQGQARAAVPPDPLRVVDGHPLTLHGSPLCDTSRSVGVRALRVTPLVRDSSQSVSVGRYS